MDYNFITVSALHSADYVRIYPESDIIIDYTVNRASGKRLFHALLG